jgi:hypothetical protein
MRCSALQDTKSAELISFVTTSLILDINMSGQLFLHDLASLPLLHCCVRSPGGERPSCKQDHKKEFTIVKTFLLSKSLRNAACFFLPHLFVCNEQQHGGLCWRLHLAAQMS